MTNVLKEKISNLKNVIIKLEHSCYVESTMSENVSVLLTRDLGEASDYLKEYQTYLESYCSDEVKEKENNMLNFVELFDMIGKPVFIINEDEKRWIILDWICKYQDSEEIGATDSDVGYNLKDTKVYKHEPLS